MSRLVLSILFLLVLVPMARAQECDCTITPYKPSPPCFDKCTTSIRTISIFFKSNSSIIDITAKRTMDEAVAWARREKAMGNANGWLGDVVGFADSTGNTARNRALSKRRVNAVIEYLGRVHGLDLSQLVQPFGYTFGYTEAERANNEEGRAKNRRVEIRIYQREGIVKFRALKPNRPRSAPSAKEASFSERPRQQL